MQTPFPTPTPVPSAELVKQAGEIISIWNTLQPIMAVLFVCVVALGIVAFVIWIGRGNSSAAIKVLAEANAAKERENIELRALREQERAEFIKGLTVIADQSTRSNDLFEAMNNRGGERDKQQQRMVETQDKISKSFEALLHEGSEPLQKVAADMAAVMTRIGTMDTRTLNIEKLLESIPELKRDFNARLDSLFIELAKRSTKPIPAVSDTETSP